MKKKNLTEVNMLLQVIWGKILNKLNKKREKKTYFKCATTCKRVGKR
jgi:cell fate (sporulation/competence/biofilm development) regulator YmcA (YheA/YmcA/DUF963 family)